MYNKTLHRGSPFPPSRFATSCHNHWTAQVWRRHKASPMASGNLYVGIWDFPFFVWENKQPKTSHKNWWGLTVHSFCFQTSPIFPGKSGGRATSFWDTPIAEVLFHLLPSGPFIHIPYAFLSPVAVHELSDHDTSNNCASVGNGMPKQDERHLEICWWDLFWFCFFRPPRWPSTISKCTHFTEGLSTHLLDWVGELFIILNNHPIYSLKLGILEGGHFGHFFLWGEKWHFTLDNTGRLIGMGVWNQYRRNFAKTDDFSTLWLGRFWGSLAPQLVGK